jgi:tartrate dehydratase alpha subunit/fumarate hydratase class I-like protein
MPSNREAFIRHAAQALQKAEIHLPRDVTRALANAAKAESDERAKEQIGAILENVRLAGVVGLPMCQDTGIPIFFIEIRREQTSISALEKHLQPPYSVQPTRYLSGNTQLTHSQERGVMNRSLI